MVLAVTAWGKAAVPLCSGGYIQSGEADMLNIKSWAMLANGALVLAGAVAWTNTNTEAFAPISARQIDPVHMMTTTNDLPMQTYEDRTFVF
jgi:hypothetical protein